MAVEAAGAEQGLVEDLGPVGRRHDDHALARVEAVHLRQKLVQGLLPLLMGARHAHAARAADRVELVDEDDARRLLHGLLEQVAHARRAHAHEHLDELGAAHGEERHLGFAGDRLCQKRLAGARRSHEQHALGDAAAELGELVRDA